MKSCIICGKQHMAKGYCRKHYVRFLKYGSPHYTKYAERTAMPLKCEAPECSRLRVARGLCKAHYDRLMGLGGIANLNGDIYINRYERKNPKRLDLHRLFNTLKEIVT